MVSRAAPCPAIIARAVASRSRRLRAASARSACGGPQVTGWFTGPTLRPTSQTTPWAACDGTLVIASASGSQLASYAWGAAHVIFVAGAQKLVPTLQAAHERIYQHSLVLEDARAIAAYGQHSSVGKILEIHQELPGRIHIVLVRQVVGF